MLCLDLDSTIARFHHLFRAFGLPQRIRTDTATPSLPSPSPGSPSSRSGGSRSAPFPNSSSQASRSRTAVTNACTARSRSAPPRPPLANLREQQRSLQCLSPSLQLRAAPRGPGHGNSGWGISAIASPLHKQPRSTPIPRPLRSSQGLRRLYATLERAEGLRQQPPAWPLRRPRAGRRRRLVCLLRPCPPELAR